MSTEINYSPNDEAPTLASRLAEMQMGSGETQVNFLGRLAIAARESPREIIALDDLPAEPLQEWDIREIRPEAGQFVRADRELKPGILIDVDFNKYQNERRLVTPQSSQIILMTKKVLLGDDLKIVYQLEGLIEAESRRGRRLALTPIQKEVVKLLLQPYSEIAEALNISEAASRERLIRAAERNDMSMAKFIKTASEERLFDPTDMEFSIPKLERIEILVLEQILLPINKVKIAPGLSYEQITNIRNRIYGKMRVYTPMQAFIAGLASNYLEGI